MSPVVQALEAAPGITHAACVTGQHRQMLDSVLQLFQIQPQYDLNIMKPGQDLTYATIAILEGVGKIIDTFKPDWIIVQGDTTTAFSGALAAYYRKVQVAHVEAGLRTGNNYSPWPEEGNRKLVGQLTSIHFPPTEKAAENLRRENVPADAITVTGNTVIDALRLVARRLETDASLQCQLAKRFDFLDPTKKLILVTGHRRENFDGGLRRVCETLSRVTQLRSDIEFVYPVHLNPNVQTTTNEILGDCKSVHLIAPQDYLPFVYLMQRAYVIITDSGGIQEEAPGLGKPVLVTRDTTERPEAIDAGTAKLVGTSSEGLLTAIMELLDQPHLYTAMAQARNPFGEGHAAERIVERLVGS